MTIKAALIISGLTALGAVGPASFAVAASAPTHATVLAVDRDRSHDADDSKIPCPKLLDARNRLARAQADLGNILADLPRNDSAYPKIKEAQRQIIDGMHSMESRLQRNGCPM